MEKKMFQDRKTLGLAIILLVVALLLGLRYGSPSFARWNGNLIKQTPLTITTAFITTKNKPVPLMGTGLIESPTTTTVSAEFSGRISELYVSEGQSVKVGQPLLTLQGAVESAAGNSTVSKIATPSAQGSSSYNDALKEYNRSKNLYEQGAIPRRQLDNATARLASLEENNTNVQESGSTDNAPVRRVNASTTVNAPINGKVVGLGIATEKMVQSGQQLMILDSGEVQVVIPIEEKDLSLVHLGTAATIQLGEQIMVGQVVSIYPEVGTNNIPVFRTYIKVTNDTNGLLKVGMAVTVNITTGNFVKVLLVPNTAVLKNDQGLYYIYLVDNGKASRRQISVVDAKGDFIEFTAEVPEQAVVITNKVNEIRNGDAILVAE